MIWQTRSTGSADTEKLGEIIGKKLKGGEVIELRSDLGGGKTTFARGLARGLGIAQNVTSPTFTISRVYKGRNKIELRHFDFYRLPEAGIMSEQLAEFVNDPDTVSIIEWGKAVKDVLPPGRLKISLTPTASESDVRDIEIKYPEELANLIRQARGEWETLRP